MNAFKIIVITMAIAFIAGFNMPIIDFNIIGEDNMKLDIQNFMPDGVELTTGNPESVTLDSDKTHVIMRFAVKSIEPEQDAFNKILAGAE